MGNVQQSATNVASTVLDTIGDTINAAAGPYIPPSRVASPSERAILLELQGKLANKMRSENTADVDLLKRIWEVAIAPEIAELDGDKEFTLSSQYWRSYLGFQREEPLSDIRGGGRLAGEAILYFCKSQRGKEGFQRCLRRRRAAIEKDGPSTFNSYPLAPAIVNMVRSVGALFNICTVHGAGVDVAVAEGRLYGLLDRAGSVAFFDAVVEGMEIIDEQFEVVGGGYMAFPEVNKRSIEILTVSLNRKMQLELEK